jgi:hypothetical protein
VELLAEHGPGFGLGEAASATVRWRERSHRAADERVAAAHLACLAGDLRRPTVEPRDIRFEPVDRQPPAVRPERQGLDQLGTGLQVFAMRRADQLRTRSGQFVEAGALGHPAAVHERAHAAVCEQRASGQPFAKAGAR